MFKFLRKCVWSFECFVLWVCRDRSPPSPQGVQTGCGAYLSSCSLDAVVIREVGSPPSFSADDKNARNCSSNLIFMLWLLGGNNWWAARARHANLIMEIDHKHAYKCCMTSDSWDSIYDLPRQNKTYQPVVIIAVYCWVVSVRYVNMTWTTQISTGRLFYRVPEYGSFFAVVWTSHDYHVKPLTKSSVTHAIFTYAKHQGTECLKYSF